MRQERLNSFLYGEVDVLRKLMLVLAGMVLALTIAIPASASKPDKLATSAHALCMQAIEQANQAFAANQRAERKKLHTDQVAAKKAPAKKATVKKTPVKKTAAKKSAPVKKG